MEQDPLHHPSRTDLLNHHTRNEHYPSFQNFIRGLNIVMNEVMLIPNVPLVGQADHIIESLEQIEARLVTIEAKSRSFWEPPCVDELSRWQWITSCIVGRNEWRSRATTGILSAWGAWDDVTSNKM